jgi:hypothetical protein
MVLGSTIISASTSPSCTTPITICSPEICSSVVSITPHSALIIITPIHAGFLPNISNPNFQTFYRPQMSSQYYPMNSTGQPINQFVPTTYQPLNRPIFTNEDNS